MIGGEVGGERQKNDFFLKKWKIPNKVRWDLESPNVWGGIHWRREK